eukprot:jgi/Chlat1/85/Chrsp1S03079
MGKNDFLTPKAIANRIKSKGLQKLKWYCQMCQKQCRDENGFKCHCTSEGHQRMMQVFGSAPKRFIEGYSEEFESTFMEHLKRTHYKSRVMATVVWNEYIADKHHIHMNATKWTTLTEFVKYLGREGKCVVDETPKGWFVTYIDRDSEEAIKEAAKAKRQKAELVDEERQARAVLEQAERAAQSMKQEEAQPAYTELRREDGEAAKVAIAMKPPVAVFRKDTTGSSMPAQPVPIFAKDEESSLKREKDREPASIGKRDGLSTLEALMKEQESVKEKKLRRDFWLTEGIIVKVLSKALKDYYKQKGVVEKVIDRYVAQVKMLDSGHVLKVDQAELETVLPQIGGLVRIVNGAYRGSQAKLLGVDMEKFTARVQIVKGAYDGRVITAIEYEDICKLAAQ